MNPGASPQEIETEITDKIEGAVNTISSIDELRSTSVEGVSQVFITFLLEKNPDIAAHLLLSRRTVQAHVSHILDKLEVHSRIEIARTAASHRAEDIAVGAPVTLRPLR